MKYKSTNINILNSFFYSRLDNPFIEGGLADFFTKIEPIQEALAKVIEELVPKPLIRVKELGTGKDLARWKIISQRLSKKKWQVVLTDFTDNLLPDVEKLPPNKNFSFKSEIDNLLEPINTLNKKERFDVFLATYVFDSIWFPEDAHLEKIDGKWYQAEYKLEGNLKNKPKIRDFKKISIRKRLKGKDLDKFEYGEIISQYYSHKRNIKVNFPGGLIKRIAEAYDAQLASDGAFIIGDMAVNSKKGYIPKDSPDGRTFYMEDYNTSGKVAKFKLEDYGLAKVILEKDNYRVKLTTVEDFVKNSGYEIPLKVRDHWIMVVSKP